MRGTHIGNTIVNNRSFAATTVSPQKKCTFHVLNTPDKKKNDFALMIQFLFWYEYNVYFIS